MSSEQQPASPGARPHVIIVGAGIGGLTLALLLERAGVPYIILEKASSSKPLGSAFCLSATVTYLFRQLGIFEEFKDNTLPSEELCAYDHECKPVYTMDFQLGVPIPATPFTWVTFTTMQRTICWMVVEHSDESSSKEHDSFRNSEWGAGEAGAMAESVRHFPIPNGGKSGTTMGHLIDKTDKDLISKVVLEEKVFKTWYGGRTVLLGDGNKGLWWM
ncbi:hypothetical protein EMPS_07411 [Entomortierella parvispora]|uniref:FAD-binding domain-containing protein n=1 Tax=Entomortierella parvispora TaxID=205924 RepID=A0A9P3LYF1_9FUNG|nr:hypothetical protein EMPS_07411 [Entomortierella parvispora]